MNSHWRWQIPAFIIVTAAAVLVGISFDREISTHLPESTSLMSIFNRRPSGYSGFFEIARKTGITASAWQSPYRMLPGGKGTLVIIAPSQSLQYFEVQQILNWVARGNRVIYLDHFIFKFEQRLIQTLGLSATPSPTSNNVVIKTTANRPELKYVPSITVTAETRLNGGTPLVSDPTGALLSEVKHGDGRVLVGVMPGLCSNHRLSSKADWYNFQLLINCLRTTDGDVWFDEICHGYSQGKNVFLFLGSGPIGLMGFQLALLLIAALLSPLQRFGAPDTVPSQRRISNLEFVNGLAAAYQRAKATDLVYEVINHSFKSKLARSLGVSPHGSMEELAKAWYEATGIRTGEMQSLVEFSTRVSKKKPSQAELIELLATCDKISEQSRTLLDTKRGRAS